LLTCHLNDEECDLLEDTSLLCRCCSDGFVNQLWEMENCPDVGNNNKVRFSVARCSTTGSTERCRRKEGMKSLLTNLKIESQLDRKIRLE